MTKQELESFLIENDMEDEEFASIVGVTEGAVKHWLRGAREIPGPVSTIVSYCVGRNVDIRDFGGRDEED